MVLTILFSNFYAAFIIFFFTLLHSVPMCLSSLDNVLATKRGALRRRRERRSEDECSQRRIFRAPRSRYSRGSAEEIAKSLGSFAGRIGALNKQ